MSNDNEIISKYDYDKTHPVYIKIKKEFSRKLKAKYNCENFDKVVDYVMEFVFEKKATKAECINNMDKLFNGKADVMMDYLWDLTKDIENSSENDHYNRRSSRKYYKYRERSRSYSNEKTKNKFDYPKYNKNMMIRGFYPPKIRYGPTIMPMNMVYPNNYNPYLITNPAMMQR